MKLIYSAVLFAFFAFLVHGQGCPNGRRIRYEWNDLPEGEKQRFLRTLGTLHQTGDGFNDLVRLHQSQSRSWHNSAYFLPAHRQFLMDFEEKLREIDPEVIIPYWDWSRDAQSPASSNIWNYFSRDGDSNCVSDNVLGSKPLSVPNQHCLVRGLTTNGPQVGSFIDSATLGDLESTINDFGTWSETIELGGHALVHVSVGGNTGDMTFFHSPNDPLFWLHHGFIDKLWDDWQNFSPGRRNQFNGESAGFGDAPVASISDRVRPWGVRVSSLMDLSGLCVEYRDPGSRFVGLFSGIAPPPPSTSSTKEPPKTTSQQDITSPTSSQPPKTNTEPAKTVTSTTDSPKSTTSTKISTSNLPKTNTQTEITTSSDLPRTNSQPASSTSLTSTSVTNLPGSSTTVKSSPTKISSDSDKPVRPTQAPEADDSISLQPIKPLPVPDFFLESMGIPKNKADQARQRLEKSFNTVKDHIAKGESVVVIGKKKPVKLKSPSEEVSQSSDSMKMEIGLIFSVIPILATIMLL